MLAGQSRGIAFHLRRGHVDPGSMPLSGTSTERNAAAVEADDAGLGAAEGCAPCWKRVARLGRHHRAIRQSADTAESDRESYAGGTEQRGQHVAVMFHKDSWRFVRVSYSSQTTPDPGGSLGATTGCTGGSACIGVAVAR